MKKKNLKALELNKKSVSNLNQDQVIGRGITSGCSDGCTPFQSAWNCTRTNCSADCENGSQSCYCTRDE